MFADSRRQPHFEVFDPYLKFAARYEVIVDGMEHNDFVSQGTVGKNDSIRRNYEAICAVIVSFLDAYLKGDAQARAVVTEPRRGGLLQLRYKAPQSGAAHQRANRQDVRERGPVGYAGIGRVGEERRTRPADRCRGPAGR